jgi:hypothetical protein
MGDVAPTDAGLASGIVNTAFMMGGALGLAVLVSVADSRTSSLRDAGDGPLAALTGGYHTAFLVGAAFAAAGALCALLLHAVVPPAQEQEQEQEQEHAPATPEPAQESAAT